MQPTRLLADGLCAKRPQAATRLPPGSSPTAPSSATVLGRGAVRLGIGNVYLKRSRRVVLGTTSTPGWYAIEAIWIRQPGHPGTLTVHGARLGKPGPIEVGSSNVGPGNDALPLTPGSANTAPGGLQLYPAAIWVHSGGCYAVTVHGRGVDDRIVFGAQAR